MGIEPTYSAWKAAALPLCYTRYGFQNESFGIIAHFQVIVKKKIPAIASGEFLTFFNIRIYIELEHPKYWMRYFYT